MPVVYGPLVPRNAGEGDAAGSEPEARAGSMSGEHPDAECERLRRIIRRLLDAMADPRLPRATLHERRREAEEALR